VANQAELRPGISVVVMPRLLPKLDNPRAGQPGPAKIVAEVTTMTMPAPLARKQAATVTSWLSLPQHQAWLNDQAARLLRFFRPTVSETGWFSELDDDGRPLPAGCPPASQPQQNLLTVARAVHSYAAGELLGVPGCSAVVEMGLRAMWEQHRDPYRGGYYNAVGHNGPTDTTKTAYNHAFVLLSASTALVAGHLAATDLFDDVTSVIDEHFWSEVEGASREAFDKDWRELEAYRGANSNMHLTESFLAAADARGRPDLKRRADRIASKLVDGFARANAWLLPEHYDPSWQPVLGYNREHLDHPFRPYGATVGHSVEWARLVVCAAIANGDLQLGSNDGMGSTGLGQSSSSAEGGPGAARASERSWHLGAAEALFQKAVQVGWDWAHGGLAYTVDWDGGLANPDHYWWPVTEAISTSAYLSRLTGDAKYETWYRRFWDYASEVLIDHQRGGWYPLFDRDNRPKAFPWYGKPDIYHSLQACLLPLLPVAPSLVGAIKVALSTAAIGAERPLG